MDTRGNIHFTRDEYEKMFPISEKQLNETVNLSKRKRKGYMRNQPCVCGSEIKFKKCCWSKYK